MGGSALWSIGTTDPGRMRLLTRWPSPTPLSWEAVAQLAREPHVDADTAWAQLAHLTPEQRAQVERVMGDLVAMGRDHHDARSRLERE